jgi:hypothetical protein
LAQLGSLSALCADRRVLEEIVAGVAQANTQLSLPEQIPDLGHDSGLSGSMAC